jgi:hypothetical protein
MKNARRDSQHYTGSRATRPGSLMGTPVVPWILEVSGAADLSRPVHACRTPSPCDERTSDRRPRGAVKKIEASSIAVRPPGRASLNVDTG